MDMKSPQDWLKGYEALQSQYWTAWSDLTNKNAPSPAVGMPWQQGVEQWSRMFADGGKQSETAERLMSSAKGYMSLMQAMLSGASAQNAGAGGMQNWLDSLRSSFNVPGGDAALMNNPIAKAMRDLSGPGAKGFEQFSSGFAPFLQQVQQEGASWLNAPAFGHNREQQEHLQKLAAAMLDFQQATQRYNALMMQSSQRGFEIFEGKLAERSEPGRQLDSIKAFYDLWVDAAEEAYAEIALSEEFRKVYAEVVNAQMRLRAQIQHQVERIGVDLGMPTRTELNSVHKRLHELRRELRELKGESGTQTREGHDEQLIQLRAEVEALKRALARSSTVSVIPTVKPTSSAAKPAAAKSAAVKLAAPPIVPSEKKHSGAAARATAPQHTTKRGNASRGRAAPTAVGTKPRDGGKPKSGAFGDAISAMRRKVANKNEKKKSARAEIAKPVKISKPVTRAGKIDRNRRGDK